MMPGKLYWNTVSPLLQSGLRLLMEEPLFDGFRLVGGTCLSLHIGHRMSVDIDLFTDVPYGSVNFQQIDDYLRQQFAYVAPSTIPEMIALGTSYIVGETPENAFKLDLFYTTDPFIYPIRHMDAVRLASKQEIAAMKIDVVQRIGRKKDFWDIHALLDEFTLAEIIKFHEDRYCYSHDPALIKKNLTDFTAADEDFDPVCLRGKHWELIKLDISEMSDTI